MAMRAISLRACTILAGLCAAIATADAEDDNGLIIIVTPATTQASEPTQAATQTADAEPSANATPHAADAPTESIVRRGDVDATAAAAPTDADLAARVAVLEAEVATLRRQLAQANAALGRPDARALALIRERSRQRLRDDVGRFSQSQLIEIERLYQLSNEPGQRGTPRAQAALEKLVTTYPDSSRAGPAVLNLAQWSQGERREKWLRDAMDNHAGDFYPDGCQVGPYATFLLARDLDQAGETEKARTLDDRIRREAPQAIDHDGRTLISQLPVR